METPDTRLVSLHAENGSPHARLSSALAALEEAEWGLMLRGEAGLARQLAALLGAGTLRADPRVSLNREVFAAYGLAIASTGADWQGARAVWLLEPSERDLKRAERSGVAVIADGTLAPGSGWLRRGVQYLVYRDGATLSGFGDLEISAIFGKGKAPARAASAPSDLSLAMALRDLATLPLRLARAARSAEALAARLGGAAQMVGPTALLLAPDSAAPTHAPLGGVLAAAQPVAAGTLLTPGVQGIETALSLLRRETVSGGSRSEGLPPRQTETRREQRRPDETPQTSKAPPRQPEAPLDYVPEIVLSGSLRQHDVTEGSADLTQVTPVSSGPDEPDHLPPLESAEQRVSEALSEESQEKSAAPEVAEAEVQLPPDFPETGAADPLGRLDEGQQRIFARLRDWRNAEAKRLEISRFIVASNATLAEIARIAPQNAEELRQVRGMGPERMRKYGEAILAALRG